MTKKVISVTIRISKELRDAIDSAAEANGRDRSKQVIFILRNDKEIKTLLAAE